MAIEEKRSTAGARSPAFLIGGRNRKRMARKRHIRAAKVVIKADKRRRLRLGNLSTIAGIAQFERRLLRIAMASAVVGEGGKLRPGDFALTINDVYKLAAVCGVLVKTLEVSELSDRLTRIEERLKERETT